MIRFVNPPARRVRASLAGGWRAWQIAEMVYQIVNQADLEKHKNKAGGCNRKNALCANPTGNRAADYGQQTTDQDHGSTTGVTWMLIRGGPEFRFKICAAGKNRKS